MSPSNPGRFTEAVGSSWTFGLFAALNVGALVFTLKKIPETKDHELEDLEEMFRTEYSRDGATGPASTDSQQHKGGAPTVPQQDA